MNNRRSLLIVLGATPFTPRAVFAQSKQSVLIGWLHTDSRELSKHYLSTFKEGLATLGWREGAQYVIEERWASGQLDRLPSLAAELAATNPVIIVAALTAAVVAAVRAAPRTPIVMASGGDVVALGYAQSLARPGGMVTGVANIGYVLAEKHVEFLLAAAPRVKRIGVLIDSNAPGHDLSRQAVHRSIAQYQVEARYAELASPEEIAPALSRLAKQGAQALIVTGGLMLRSERRRIVKLAMVQRWPVVAGGGEWAEAGALLNYSADLLANYRRAGYYVDRILKGAKPGDLPIEQPMTFELAVNMKTAKLLGLSMPPEIMVRATRVIE